MVQQIGNYDVVTIFTGEPWCQNCYLVKCRVSGEMVVIDPGDKAEAIIAQVRAQVGVLKAVLITHAHHDHIVALSEVVNEFDVPCYLHKDDTRLLRQAHTYALVFDKRKIDPIRVSCRHFNEKLKIGEQEVRVIPAPGHTSGSVCFGFGMFVFTGDLVLFEHVGRSDTPGSNMEQLRDSVGYLLEQLADDVIIFPGHGRTWAIGEARQWHKELDGALPEYKRFGHI